MTDIHIEMDPWQSDAPAAQAAARAAAVSDEPAAPAEKPSVWGRVSKFFTRQREDATATYQRLLKTVEIDGRDLSDKQINELGAAMTTAGISQEEAAEHREAIRRFREGREAAARLPASKAREAKLQAELDVIQVEAERLQKKSSNLTQDMLEATCESRSLTNAADRAAGVTAWVAALFD